jgi:hypothetical protein
LKRILGRLGNDFYWLRPFPGVQIKRFGCHQAGGEVAKHGLPELLEISFVKGRPRGKDKVAALPNDIVDSCNVPGRNEQRFAGLDNKLISRQMMEQLFSSS